MVVDFQGIHISLPKKTGVFSQRNVELRRPNVIVFFPQAKQGIAKFEEATDPTKPLSKEEFTNTYRTPRGFVWLPSLKKTKNP